MNKSGTEERAIGKNESAEKVQKLIVFNSQSIRRVFYQEEWWFSIIDVMAAISESSNPKRYWSDLKKQLIEKEGFFQPYEKIVRLKMDASDGRSRETDCANTKTIFRLVQSMPTPKAEPFRQWLAQVGYERVKEIEDPELASQRARDIYLAKGYSKEWIEKRVRSIAIREELTDEWKQRQVGESREFAILTAEISQATFGMKPSEYKRHKGLNRENLRDHMNDLELIFSMLGEASTTEIARNKNAQGFDQNKKAAQEGGSIAGNARHALEIKSGRPVITKENYLKIENQESTENTKNLKSESARKLAWACRRGMLELDILLQRYLDQKYELADVQEQADFKKLLECQDQVLFECLVKRQEEKLNQSEIEPGLIYLLEKIRN